MSETSSSAPQFTIEKVILERQKFYQSLRVKNDDRVLGLFTVGSMSSEVEYDVNFNEWIIRFEADVLSEKLAEDYYTGYSEKYAFPKTWWDHFKETYGHKWWLRWWYGRHGANYEHKSFPVKVKVERFANYPESNLAFPGLGRAIPYERITQV